MQTPKTPKEIAAEHLIGVKITTTLSLEPAAVIAAKVTGDGLYHFDCEGGRIIETNALDQLYVICRGGCRAAPSLPSLPPLLRLQPLHNS